MGAAAWRVLRIGPLATNISRRSCLLISDGDLVYTTTNSLLSPTPSDPMCLTVFHSGGGCSETWRHIMHRELLFSGEVVDVALWKGSLTPVCLYWQPVHEV